VSARARARSPCHSADPLPLSNRCCWSAVSPGVRIRQAVADFFIDKTFPSGSVPRLCAFSFLSLFFQCAVKYPPIDTFLQVTLAILLLGYSGGFTRPILCQLTVQIIRNCVFTFGTNES